jgi:copper(I)-binding protein
MKLMRIALMIMTVLSMNASANQLSVDQVKFSNAWVKMPMPGMNMTAAFVDIKNLSNRNLKLLAVTTPVSMVAELHSMVMVDNVMQMRQVKNGWVIKPEGTLTLAPGGKHAMLMGINPNLKNQLEAVLEFNIEGIGWISVPTVVRKPNP